MSHISDLIQLNKVDCPILFSSQLDRVTSSADWPPSRAPATSSWTQGAPEKVGGQRAVWIVSGHRGWFKSHGLLKCQRDSWSVIRNPSKLLEKCVDAVAFVLITYFSCSFPCVSMRKACLLVEHNHFTAMSENTSCGATQDCSQACGDATAPPGY